MKGHIHVRPVKKDLLYSGNCDGMKKSILETGLILVRPVTKHLSGPTNCESMKWSILEINPFSVNHVASKWLTFALKYPLICKLLYLKEFLYARKNPPWFSTKSITFELLAYCQAFNYSFLKLDGGKSLSICFSMLVILLKIHVFFTFMFPHVFVISFLLISF